jgi:hypothetical protein
MVGGAFFHTRVRMPRMSRSSISKGEPGPVNAAFACLSEMAGNFFATATSPPARARSDIGEFSFRRSCRGAIPD